MAIKQYIVLIALFVVFLSFGYDAFARECTDKVYIINLEYDQNQNLNFLSQEQNIGCYPASTTFYPVVFEIKKVGQVYYSTSFDYKVIYTDVVYGNTVIGGVKNAHKTRFTLVVPFREDVDGFEVKEEGRVILAVDKQAFYSKQKSKGGGSGLFDWVDNLLKGLLEDLFS